MIGYKIERQNYEIILEQIGAILVSEFENQETFFYNTDCVGVKFWLERSTTFDKSELPAINLCLSTGQYDNKHAGYANGAYTFYVDVLTNSKTTQDTPGDKLAALKANRLMGICRAIIEDPIYRTLGFARGSLENHGISGFETGAIKNVGDTDALSTKINRLTVSVKAKETTVLPDGLLLLGNLTKVRLNETEKGFQYEFLES